MSRSTLKSKESSNSAAPQLVRTTLILPAALDRNLELLCLMEGVSKTEMVKSALAHFLEQRGLQPYKIPKAVIEY